MSAAAGVMVGKRLGRKEYDEAYTESKKIMYAGLAGAVAVSTLLVLLAGVYTGLYRVDGSVKRAWKDTAYCVCPVCTNQGGKYDTWRWNYKKRR